MSVQLLNPYTVEAHYPDVPYLAGRDYWLVICNDRLEFCRGFMQARRESPLLCGALRLVRQKDGRIMDSVPARTEIGVGMVAGYPTGRQQLDAVRRTLGRVRAHAEYVSDEEAALAARALAVLDGQPDPVGVSAAPDGNSPESDGNSPGPWCPGPAGPVRRVFPPMFALEKDERPLCASCKDPYDPPGRDGKCELCAEEDSYDPTPTRWGKCAQCGVYSVALSRGETVCVVCLHPKKETP